MMGKFAVIIGPAMMGVVGLAARNLIRTYGPADMAPDAVARMASRISISSVVLLFVIGGVLFYLANRSKSKTGA